VFLSFSAKLFIIDFTSIYRHNNHYSLKIQLIKGGCVRELEMKCAFVSFLFLAVFFIILELSGGIYSAIFFTLIIFIPISLICGEFSNHATNSELSNHSMITPIMMALNLVMPVIGAIALIASTKRDSGGLAFFVGWTLIIYGILVNIFSICVFAKNNKVSFLKTLLILLTTFAIMLLPTIPFIK
jgi:hypothetical protein